jgi:hypothetical protein
MKTTIMRKPHKFQEPWNFSLGLSFGVTPPASSPGIGVYAEALMWSYQVIGL